MPSGSAARDTWLSAMGIDRWVERTAAPEEITSQSDTSASVVWIQSNESPRLCVLTQVPLDDLAFATLGKMLAAIGVSIGDCAVAVVPSVDVPVDASAAPVLALAHDADESAWRACTGSHAWPSEAVPHPARFVAEPALKRPAWEAMKRLGKAIA